MIVDAETLDLTNSIEGSARGSARVPTEGEVKPELMESVCEIATTPCRNTAEAGAQLRGAAPPGSSRPPPGAASRSAPPARIPFAMWEDQRIVSRPRYRDLIAGLQFVARQEIIFGIHVHVGVDDPDKAIHVTNGMRVHLPLLLALSANSPFWRGDQTGLDSTRTPIFRAFPRVGIPPRYDDFEDWAQADRVHVRVEGDPRLHLPLVRRAPAPELRHGRGARDGLADAGRAHAGAGGARAGDGQGAGRALRVGPASSRATPTRCSTRTSGSPRGTGSRASSSTCRTPTRVPARELARRLLDAPAPARPGARLAGGARRLEDLLEHGNGASRQVVVYDANHDLREVVREIVDATVPAAGRDPRRVAARRPGTLSRRVPAGPLRRLQELRVRGQPVRHRVPVLRAAGAQAGAEAGPLRRASRSPTQRERRTRLPRLRRRRSRGSRRTRGRTRTFGADRRLAAERARLRRRRRAGPRLPRWCRSTTTRSGAGSPAPFLYGDLLGYQFVDAAVGRRSSARCSSAASACSPGRAIFLLAGAAGSALAVTADVGPLLSATSRLPRCSAPTAPRSACSAPGWWTTASPSGAATTARTTCIGVYVFAVVLLLLSLAVLGGERGRRGRRGDRRRAARPRCCRWSRAAAARY